MKELLFATRKNGGPPRRQEEARSGRPWRRDATPTTKTQPSVLANEPPERPPPPSRHPPPRMDPPPPTASPPTGAMLGVDPLSPPSPPADEHDEDVASEVPSFLQEALQHLVEDDPSLLDGFSIIDSALLEGQNTRTLWMEANHRAAEEAAAARKISTKVLRCSSHSVPVAGAYRQGGASPPCSSHSCAPSFCARAPSASSRR